ncbi:MAG: metallophosphoesterase [Actinomycetota bacterium]
MVQLTDSHLTSRLPRVPPVEFSDAVHLLTGRTANDATSSVWSKIAEAEPSAELVLHTGDIADDQTLETYKTAEALLEGLAIPVMVTPGNHDDPKLVGQVFGDRAALTARATDAGGWRIILASSWDEGNHGGTFTDGTLAELDRLLDFDGPILVGTHHPPLSPCSHPDCTNRRSAEFLSMIDSHQNVKAVVAGHLHLCDEIGRRGVRHFISPSSALQLSHVHPLEDNNSQSTPAGARLLDLNPDGSIDTEIVWA